MCWVTYTNCAMDKYAITARQDSQYGDFIHNEAKYIYDIIAVYVCLHNQDSAHRELIALKEKGLSVAR